MCGALRYRAPRRHAKDDRTVTLEDLRKEFEHSTIGPIIWGLLLELTGSVAHRYPPDVYNVGQAWNRSSFEELAQDVVAECLLGEGQLQYAFDVADGLESFRRLLVRQIKRSLYRRRRTTVVDRLLRRARGITSQSPFEVSEAGRERWITLGENPIPLRTLNESELRNAAALVGDIPRLAETGNPGRASMVYTTPFLLELVQRLVSGIGGLTESDLAKIFEILLTAWLPTFLENPEENQIPTTDTVDSGLEQSHMVEIVQAFANTLDETDRFVLLYKSQDMSDAALAIRVGRSRPWVSDRKKDVLARVESELMSEVHPDHHGLAIRMLLAEISDQMEGAPNGSP